MSEIVRPNNHISAIMKEYVEELELKYRNPGELCGISTGYDCLDYKLGGLKSGEVTIIGGRPAMGKTALADNLTYNIAPVFIWHINKIPKRINVWYISVWNLRRNCLQTDFFLCKQQYRRINYVMPKIWEKILIKFAKPNALLENCRFIIWPIYLRSMALKKSCKR